MLRFWLALFLLVFIGGMLAACAPELPIIENLNVPENTSPTSVFLAYRTPIPTWTAEIPFPTPTENLDPDYYFGGMMITMDDVGKIISLREGQDFYLSLGELYLWDIDVDPPELVSQNMKITPLPGDQGVFIARDSGFGVLRATGEPSCRKMDPPCNRPDILFQVFIQVE